MRMRNLNDGHDGVEDVVHCGRYDRLRVRVVGHKTEHTDTQTDCIHNRRRRRSVKSSSHHSLMGYMRIHAYCEQLLNWNSTGQLFLVASS